MEYYKSFGLFMVGMVGLLLLCVFILPAILQVPSTYNGEVTSISITDYGLQSTFINFKDGSTLRLWGIHNISLGNHTFQVVSSYVGYNNLIKLD